jgi:glycosyltransferase involved in cell wall biosynthesis
VYNGEERIGDTIRDLLAYLVDAELDDELLVVDDGSTDQTPARSHDAIEGAPIPVQFVHSPANEGRGAAVRRGMQLARGTLRVFIDADLAYPPSDIGKMVRRLQAGADVAIVSRVHPDSRYVISPSFFRYLYTRHVSGRVFNWLV